MSHKTSYCAFYYSCFESYSGDFAPDCDCACAETLLVRTPYVAHLPWQLPKILYCAPLIQDYAIAFNPIGYGVVAALDMPTLAELETFARPRSLTNATAQQLATLGLLTPVPSPAVTSPPHTLTAWLHLTEACNLHCAYCYVRQGPRAMDQTLGFAAIDAVFRSAVANGYQAVKLKYAGGEPTLAWPLIPILHRYAQDQATRTGLDLRATVLSNGTRLTPPMLDWFAHNNVRLMFSLDGIGEIPDAQRPFADGRGSFAALARNLDLALRAGVKPYLSITVTGQNVEGLADTVRFALEHGLSFHLNFSRALQDVARMQDLEEHARWIAALRAAFAVTMPYPGRHIDAFLDLMTISPPHNHPCAAGRHYLVVGPAGHISPCQMLLEEPVTDVWADDPLAIIRTENGLFSNPVAETQPDCHDCTWRYICAGGCPLLAREAKSPYCALYRQLLPELLHLEGLRLLQNAGLAA